MGVTAKYLDLIQVLISGQDGYNSNMTLHKVSQV